jgi:hypothetical protein
LHLALVGIALGHLRQARSLKPLRPAIALPQRKQYAGQRQTYADNPHQHLAKARCSRLLKNLGDSGIHWQKKMRALGALKKDPANFLAGPQTFNNLKISSGYQAAATAGLRRRLMKM